MKFDGYKGQQAMVRLRRGEKLLEEREISIPQDHHREEVRFAQVPDLGGVGDTLRFFGNCRIGLRME